MLDPVRNQMQQATMDICNPGLAKICCKRPMWFPQVLQAAMDITPSQQERYLELADAYTSFVRQARQHKADALARIAQVRE